MEQNREDRGEASAAEPFQSGEGEVPEHLPPVEPPSAGFIVQLFLIPAIIVAVVLGVYLLFGQMAAGELNWREQVVAVGSENPHVRWKGAMALAQMLDADAQRDDDGQRLAQNPEVAAAFVELFEETLQASPRDEEVERQIEFLAKALGRLDTHERVVPVLLDAARKDDDPVVRSHALTGLAMITGRAYEQDRPLSDSELVAGVVAIANDADPLARHQAVFILGLLDSEAAARQMRSLVSHPDLMTRANAAIGLARSGSLDGLPVFEEVLAAAAEQPLDPSAVRSDAEAEAYFERAMLLTNTLTALDRLSERLGDAQRNRIADLLERVTEVTEAEAVRLQARALLATLRRERSA